MPGLTIGPEVSKLGGQFLLVRQTIIEFAVRIPTPSRLNGWGGFLGCVSTCASAGLHSLPVWFSCFGFIVFGNGMMNLVPIPTLNGGRLILLAVQATFGRLPENVIIILTYAGLLVTLTAMAMIVVADISWCAGLLLHRR